MPKLDKKTLAAVLLLGLGAGALAVTVAQATLFPIAEEEGPVPAYYAPSSDATAADAPERLIIPAIGVDAKVQHVGVTKNGNMAVPNNFIDTGWYRYGTTPGFRGSAVIDGHVDNGLALAGVFKNLSRLRAGDEVVVRAASGEERRFAVTAVENYDYRQVPLQKLFNEDDKARLNLITCDGAWIAGDKTYDRRLVVYAELVI